MPEALKRVYIANDNMEADIIKDVLEKNGIYCFIQGREHRGMLGILGAYIDLGILVPSESAQKSSIIIKEVLDSMRVEASDLPGDWDETDPEKTLPHKLRPKSYRVAIFLSFALPGAGSCYAGRPDIGSWIIGSCLICLAMLMLSIGSGPAPAFRISIPLFFIFLVILDLVLSIKTLRAQIKNPKDE